MDNQRKTVIVTGGGRGIGRAVAISFYRAGYNVVIGFAGNESAAKETVSLCKAEGILGEVALVQGDISLEETSNRLVETALSFTGKIDVVVNNAGITRDNLLVRMTEEEFSAVIATNLKGTFFLCQKVTRPMMKQRFGRIINISSVVGVHGNAGQVNYSASKAGVIGLTKSMAKELASRNITVNVVAPGMIETDMTGILNEKTKEAIFASIPAKRMGSAFDVAHAVLFFAEEKSGYITGQVLGVDGGMGM